MLDTATKSIIHARCTSIKLAQGLAQDFGAREAFDRLAPFDAIFFSYALSMMPDWRGALDNAVHHLRPGGRLYIADFWDQEHLPESLAHLLQGWLSLFGVHFRPGVHAHLGALAAAPTAALTIKPVARRYAYIAILQTAHKPTEG